MTQRRWIPWAVAAVALLLVVAWTQWPSGSPDDTALDVGAAAAGEEQLTATLAGSADADPQATAANSGADASVDSDSVDQPSDNDAATADGADAAAGAEPDGSAGDASADPTSSPTATPTAVVATPPPPTPTPEPVSGIEGYRLRVPTLGVSAYMIDLGVDDSGVMEVPLEAQTVAWYRFTAVPGEPGNILLGGHITWHGATAVFRYLEEMSNGDEIFIDTPSGETIRYVVRETWWADPYAATDVRRVIGSRSGSQTITLFTCGGTWDTSAREYSHRRVVTAVRV